MNKKTNTILLICAATVAVICITAISLLYAFVFKVPSSEEVFKNTRGSVVEIKCENANGSTAYGSAVLITSDGTLISNAHVVTYTTMGETKTFDKYYVRFFDETEYREASLLSYDVEKDLSTLQISDVSSLKLNPIEFAQSGELSSASTVYAVGNALNHGISITKGIVSLPLVNLEYNGTVKPVIQCDLIINDGNSGGALVNEYGKLIGITTFRLKDSYGRPLYGLAFCIPLSTINEYLSTK